MYWSQEGSSSIDTKIERADMDGMNRVVVKSWNYYSHTTRSPNGLALDKEQNRLYYCDDYTDRIYYVSLSTGAESTLLIRPGSPKGTVVHGSYIYWTETQGQSGAVYRADKKSGENVESVVSRLVGPEDICVYDANDSLLQTGTFHAIVLVLKNLMDTFLTSPIFRSCVCRLLFYLAYLINPLL